MADIAQTRYVRSGEVDLTYQVFGGGEDLVLIPGGASHLEVMWELAESAAFGNRLASFRRVIIFDKRGMGMSDPVPGVPALEEHCRRHHHRHGRGRVGPRVRYGMV